MSPYDITRPIGIASTTSSTLRARAGRASQEFTSKGSIGLTEVVLPKRAAPRQRLSWAVPAMTLRGMSEPSSAVSTHLNIEALTWKAMLIGLAATAVASRFVAETSLVLSIGGAVGLVAAVLLEYRRAGTLDLIDDTVVLKTHGGTTRLPCSEVRQITAEPTVVTRLRSEPETVLVTITPESGSPIRCNLSAHEAEPLLLRIAAPIMRRQASALAAGERLAFRDPRRFPTRQVMRGLSVALGALYLQVALATFALHLTVVIALFAVFFGALAKAARAIWSWSRADRGGGLLVSSMGFLQIEDAPRRRIAASVYREPEAQGPWIPWSALREVRREGYGLIIETHTLPARIQLTASTEGVLSLQALMQRQQHSSLRDQMERVRVVDSAMHDADQDASREPLVRAQNKRG